MARISTDAATALLKSLWMGNAIPRLCSGDYVVCHENGWFPRDPDELAEELSKDLKGVDVIREKLIELEERLPSIDIIYAETPKGLFPVPLDSVTAYGEPQGWVYLKNDESIEITYESYNLEDKDQYYSLRIHCSEEDFQEDKYHSTMGVVGSFNGTLSQIGKILDDIISRIGAVEMEGQRYVNK